MKVTKNKTELLYKPIKLLENPEVTEEQFMDARDWYLSAQNKKLSKKTQKSKRFK